MEMNLSIYSHLNELKDKELASKKYIDALHDLDDQDQKDFIIKINFFKNLKSKFSGERI